MISFFCPKSIYFHHLYGNYENRTYKQKPQIVGTINHESIDQQKYSSLKKYLQGMPVFCEKYRLCSKRSLRQRDKNAHRTENASQKNV